MAKAKKKDKTKSICDNIDKAFKMHETSGWKRKTATLLGYVDGNWGRSGEDNKFVINSVYNLANLIIPNLFYQTPWIRVNATKKWVVKKTEEGERFIEASRSATLFEYVINDVVKKLDLEDHWRKCVQDALVYGIGVLKVGYDPSASQVEADVNVIEKEEVFAQRICPFDFGWDPMANGPEDARFLVHRVIRTVEELQDDDNLKGTDDLKGMSLSEETPKHDKKEESKDSGEWVEVYEYHDQVANKIYTIVKQPQGGESTRKQDKGHTYKILWERDNPHDKVPCHFAVLRFTGDNDKFLAPAMLGMVEDECLATNEVFSLMINHFRMFPGLLIHEQGAVDDDELEAFENGDQGAILQVQGGALQNQRIQRTPPMPMGGEYFTGLQTIGQLKDAVLGVQDFQRQVSTKRKTATETQLEAQDSAIRRAYFLGFMKRFVLQTVKKVASLIQQYYDEDREVRIFGDFDEFWKWNNSDLDGEWGFDFDVESMRVYSASRAQGIINMLGTIAQHQILQPIMSELDPQAVAEELCKNLDVNFEALKKQRSISHIEYSPIEENEMAANGQRIPDPRPGEPHETHLSLHQQQFNIEMSKGNELGGQELIRHMQMTQFMMQVEGMLPGQAMGGTTPQGVGGPLGGAAPAGGTSPIDMAAGPSADAGLAAGSAPAANMPEGIE